MIFKHLCLDGVEEDLGGADEGEAHAQPELRRTSGGFSCGTHLNPKRYPPLSQKGIFSHNLRT